VQRRRRLDAIARKHAAEVPHQAVRQTGFRQEEVGTSRFRTVAL
jgi:hypothetical protein